MAIANKFVRVKDLYDPERCQSSTSVGPCPYKSLPGETYCQMHASGPLHHKQAREKMRNFRLNQWQSRINEFSDNSEVKSLREEIGIIRLLLENVVTLCKTPNDLLIHTGKISDLTVKIEKLVSTCHRLELQNSQLLDRGAVLNISMTIVEIIGEFIPDQNKLTVIGEKIVTAIIKSHSNTAAKIAS